MTKKGESTILRENANNVNEERSEHDNKAPITLAGSYNPEARERPETSCMPLIRFRFSHFSGFPARRVCYTAY
jgi:hypothetical protein